MKTELTSPSPLASETTPPVEITPAPGNPHVMDDSELDAEPLLNRQENAIQIITCEGGCE